MTWSLLLDLCKSQARNDDKLSEIMSPFESFLIHKKSSVLCTTRLQVKNTMPEEASRLGTNCLHELPLLPELSCLPTAV